MDSSTYDSSMGSQQHLGPMSAATYHSADGTQTFAVDEYGRHWQLPPAPKLTSAAARGWYHPMQDQNSVWFPFTAPWGGPAAHHPQQQQTEGYLRQSVGPQQHYNIEQQMILHHQSSRQYNRRSVPALHMSQQGERPHLPPLQFQSQYQSTSSRQDVLAPDYDGQESSKQPFADPSSVFQHPGWPQSHFWPEHGSSQATCSYAQYPPCGIRQEQSLQCSATQGEDASYPRLDGGSTWHDPPHVYNPRQGCTYQSATVTERRRSEFTERPSILRSSHSGGIWNPQAWSHGHERHHPFSRSQSHLRSWHGQADQSLYNGQQQLPLADQRFPQKQQLCTDDVLLQRQAAAVDHNASGAESQSATVSGPTPPSPHTLDRSGVSISAFGAEIIWSTCIGLLDPDLIRDAYRDESSDDFCHSTTSSSSSPLLSTPLTTPQSPSTGGKDIEASARLLSHLGLNYSLSDDPHQCSGAYPLTSSSPLDTSSHEIPLSQPLRSSATGLSSPMQLSSSSSSRSDSLSRVRSASKTRLGRTKSQERARGNVLSVLGLVSPHWEWTHSKHTLPSLSEQSRKSFKWDKDGAQTAWSSPLPEGNSHHLSSTCLGSESSPAFRRFAHQVLAQTLLSPTAVLLGLLYALRVSLIAVDSSGNVDPAAIKVLASPPSAAPFKLFTLGLMIANKHLDDNTFLNKTWNEVTGIPLAELNQMEQYYLIRCNYEIALPDQIWKRFLQKVKRREEDRLLADRLTKTVSTSAALSTRDESSRKLLSVVMDTLSAIEAVSALEPLDALHPLDRGEEDNYWSAPLQRRGNNDDAASSSQQARWPTSAHLNNPRQRQSAPGDMTYIHDWDPLGESGCSDMTQPPPCDAFARSLSEPKPGAISRAGSLSNSFSHPHSRFHDAPLAPSALLELLNSGRNLASAH